MQSAVVYLTSTDPGGADGAFALHQVMPAVNWTSGGLTWNTAGNGLQADGVELGVTPVDHSKVTAVIPGVGGAADRKMWDITSLAQAWVDNPASNNGFAILAPSPDREIFCAMNHPGETVRPKLVITWASP